MYFVEKKRKVYDAYGKEGLTNGSRGTPYSRNNRGYEPFVFTTFPDFVFRDPEEVFKDFFGGNVFDLFQEGMYFCCSPHFL